MKNRLGTRLLVILTSLTTIIFAAAGFAEEKAGKVEIKDKFILVHPGTKLSKADAKALNDVLKKYNKSLSKIETYKDGKVTRTQGTLSDMYLDQTTVAELAQAKSSGQSERAIQLIAPAGPQMRSSPMPAGPQKMSSSPMPAGPQRTTSPQPSVADQKAADELMERLKPILEKYTHK
jgi:hypothetical protein